MKDKLNDILTEYSRSFQKLAVETENQLAENLANDKELGVAIASALSDFDSVNNAITIKAVVSAAELGLGSEVRMDSIDMPWSKDNMKLSDRLYGASTVIRQKIRDTVLASMRNAEYAVSLSRQLYDGYNNGSVIPESELPKYLNGIVRSVHLAVMGRDVDKAEVLKRIQSIRLSVSRLESDALRTAYKDLLDDLEAFKGKTIQKAIKTAVEEKSRYTAERIARTEAARAWFEGYISRYADDEDVWGYKWGLSSNHPIHDQCDVCANADIGYGKGLYPKNFMPTIPLHPHCRCNLSPVFKWQVDTRKKPKPKQVEVYINRLPTKDKIALFGVKGFNEYKQGADWQEVLRGWNGFTNPLTRVRVHKYDNNPFDLQLFAKLPNYEKAYIAPEKLHGYLFNKEHEIGKHKAIVFESALGYNKETADKFVADVKEGLARYDAYEADSSEYGKKYNVEMTLKGPNGKEAQVNTAWIVNSSNNIPRLITALVKKKKKGDRE